MDQKRCAVASKESLKRIFTVPEAPDSTLSKIELEISSNLAGFLNENIAAIEKPLHDNFFQLKYPKSLDREYFKKIFRLR